MLSMGIEHYNQPHAVFFILEVSNAFFTTVFGKFFFCLFLINFLSFEGSNTKIKVYYLKMPV